MSSHHVSLCVQGPDGGPFELCPEDTFKNASGSESCTPCEEGGSTNRIVGSVTSEDCVAKPGWTNEKTWEDGPFVPCRVGYFKTGYGPHPCKVSLALSLALSLSFPLSLSPSLFLLHERALSRLYRISMHAFQSVLWLTRLPPSVLAAVSVLHHDCRCRCDIGERVCCR